jgi:hypothetical protein
MLPAVNHDRFYAELPLLERFIDITASHNFVSVPDDWYIVVTDIVESTQAIARGQYKAVNFVGASAIVSVLNVAGCLEIPFVFGGDGASVLIPGYLLPPARSALLATQSMAQREFGLDLRVGIVPVAVVTADYDLLIAKLRVSDNYNQAIFRGGGLTYATQLLKNTATTHLYRLDPGRQPPAADLSGLECRWQDIPSPKGEMITLLVLATAPSEPQMDRIYQDVIHHIEKIYGADPRLNPIAPQQLRLAFSRRQLVLEMQARAADGRWWSRWGYLWKMRLENLVGLALMGLGIKTPDVDWAQYRRIVTDATDHRKFDDVLRMVIAGTPAQNRRLQKYLDQRYQAGRLVYGTHISSSALMTCLVFERSGRQVHFVDGGDGGYALAALAMKQRMKG